MIKLFTVLLLGMLISGEQLKTGNMETATFGGGCFWCTEAIFRQLNGVESVESGYCGGETKNPTYRDVCTGETGHAEVIQLRFNPAVISYRELLEVFWSTHDPTTLDRQGADVGTQYRSVIFYHSEEQKKLAEKLKQELNDDLVFGKPVVTEIVPFTVFYKAEDYHQEYFENNAAKPYCQLVIIPKLNKFREIFKDRLKK